MTCSCKSNTFRLTYGVQAIRLKLADKGTKAVELGSLVGNSLGNFQGDLGAAQLEVPDCWKYAWHVDSQKPSLSLWQVHDVRSEDTTF